MKASSPPVGDLIRHWRNQRRLSQLELSLDADVSARHLCFIETGRSQPSREMIIKLSEQLEIPLRERNVLLQAAGYASAYRESEFADPELSLAREMVAHILKGHEPYPALAIDRHWNLVMANDAASFLVGLAPPELLTPPVNVIRLSLSPNGLAPHILNLEEWRDHTLGRLRREAMLTGDPFLDDLVAEIEEIAAKERKGPEIPHVPQIALHLRMMVNGHELAFFSTTTVFGTATEVTLSELALETLFPANRQTADFLAVAKS